MSKKDTTNNNTGAASTLNVTAGSIFPSGLQRYYGEPDALIGKNVKAAHPDAGIPDRAFVQNASYPDSVYIATRFADGNIDEWVGNRGLADIEFADPSDKLNDLLIDFADWWGENPTATPDPRAVAHLQAYLSNDKCDSR